MKEQLQSAFDLLQNLSLAHKQLINEVFILAKVIFKHSAATDYKLITIALMVDHWLTKDNWADTHTECWLLSYIIKKYWDGIQAKPGEIYFDSQHGKFDLYWVITRQGHSTRPFQFYFSSSLF